MITARWVLGLLFPATVLLASPVEGQTPDSTWLRVAKWQGRFALKLETGNCGYTADSVESKDGQLALRLEEVEECKLGPADGRVSTNQVITGSFSFDSRAGGLDWRGKVEAQYEIDNSTDTYVLGEFMRSSSEQGKGETNVGKSEFEIDLRDRSYSLHVYPGGETPRGIKLTVSETFVGFPPETQESDADQAGLSGTSGWVVGFPLPRFGTVLCGSVDTEETASFTWRMWPADSSPEPAAQRTATCSHWHARNPLDASNDPVSFEDVVDVAPGRDETAEQNHGSGPAGGDLFFVDLGAGGSGGTPVGCGDALVPLAADGFAQPDVTSANDLTYEVLQQFESGEQAGPAGSEPGVVEQALRRMLAVDREFVGPDSLYNALHASALGVQQVTHSGDLAAVELSGVLVTARECDAERLVGQLTATATQFLEISKASFRLDGEPLEAVLKERR